MPSTWLPPQPALHNFYTGKQHSLHADNLAALCEHFGLKLSKPTRGLAPPRV